jgi:serine/threonine-protein kinase HipA
MLRKRGKRPEQIDPITRLSIVGSSGMGGLEYRPVYNMKGGTPSEDLDRLAEECRMILQPEESGDLDLLFTMGGSSGGARPKVMIRLDGEEWIVKFPSSGDPADIGLMEYEYNLCAAACGIQIPEVKLFPSNNCPGYFGTKRFDRVKTVAGEKKIHMASASALLEVSHRVPALDYTSLMSLTWQLTKKADELLKIYTLMCFNVFAHNRDDHSKNFTFLCDHGDWRLAPAYDLTYSNSMGGEHATTIAGEGRHPTLKDLLSVAKRAGIKESAAREIVIKVKAMVDNGLSKYLS